jgi:hypothetical protein
MVVSRTSISFSTTIPTHIFPVARSLWWRRPHLGNRPGHRHRDPRRHAMEPILRLSQPDGGLQLRRLLGQCRLLQWRPDRVLRLPHRQPRACAEPACAECRRWHGALRGGGCHVCYEPVCCRDCLSTVSGGCIHVTLRQKFHAIKRIPILYMPCRLSQWRYYSSGNPCFPNFASKRTPDTSRLKQGTCTHENPEISTCSPRNPICLCTFICLIGKTETGGVWRREEKQCRETPSDYAFQVQRVGKGRVARR